jgi:GH35 family endo-1,4-beta-xylanase
MPIMGTMTFQLPPGLSSEAVRELERACVAGGPDNMPWPTRVQVSNGRLTLHREEVDESGYLLVPWEINGAGRLLGSSATLMERENPYFLQLELARGKTNQLRSQAADWTSGGLELPGKVDEQIRDAVHAFGNAVVRTPSAESEAQAQQALSKTYTAADQLTSVYIQKVFEVRQERQPRLDTVLACRLGSRAIGAAAGAVVKEACNGVSVPFTWSSIAPAEGSYDWDTADALVNWAEAGGLPVTAGPLIDFSSSQLPDWLWHWERDLATLAQHMCDYVATTVRRYRHRIRAWQLTAASNCAAVLSLAEDELLWLTVRLAEAARQVDPSLQIVVGIAQPWGEYMALEDRVHSPFIFADTLIRSGLNLQALDLELVMGLSPRGSYCRDLLEASRLLDLYAILGIPLHVTLAYPSARSSDPKADPDYRITAGHWRSGFTPQTQAQWAASFAALVLCKPYVQAATWSHLSDANPHQFPHCGLLDASDRPKPVVQELRRLREAHLR